ncbi:MAG: hypothetical protein U9N77_01075 [Thermodesulfobacteriota bacterium]|nr:hypothetical protein [Thermodesulfobacteriota bacterium]
MQNLVVKIKKALSKIESEKGDFIIKCLVARNPDDIQWDLVLVGCNTKKLQIFVTYSP